MSCHYEVHWQENAPQALAISRITLSHTCVHVHVHVHTTCTCTCTLRRGKSTAWCRELWQASVSLPMTSTPPRGRGCRQLARLSTEAGLVMVSSSLSTTETSAVFRYRPVESWEADHVIIDRCIVCMRNACALYM